LREPHVLELVRLTLKYYYVSIKKTLKYYIHYVTYEGTKLAILTLVIGNNFFEL